MAAPKRLSPIRRTTPDVEGVEAPERTQASVSEQKINQYRKRRYQALHSENEAAVKRRAKGLSTARERVETLLDDGTFVELDLFATHRAHGFGMEERKIAGDGVVAGFGEIDRRPVAVYAYDATVFGGSLGEVTAEKIVKVQELALRNRVPIIGINDSGGARIQEGVVALAGYADIFYRNVRSSGVIPQISIIAGPCTGGAVYSPAITDFIFIVAGQGYMFITGPEVIRVVTGEQINFEELGGGNVHNATSGVAHFLPGGILAAASPERRRGAEPGRGHRRIRRHAAADRGIFKAPDLLAAAGKQPFDAPDLVERGQSEADQLEASRARGKFCHCRKM